MEFMIYKGELLKEGRNSIKNRKDLEDK